MKIVWCMVLKIWSIADRIFSHLGPFYALLPPNNLENQNFEKMKKKKTTGDIIILQKCTINDNHMMYDSWDMKRDRQIFLSFWAIFCPSTPVTTQKIKILKKWKQQNFIQVYQKSWPYTILFLRYGL